MSDITIYEFKRQTEKNLNPKGFLFEIKCKECKSKEVIINYEDNTGMGSEYTGMYGSSDLIIKCTKCGNAFSIRINDY